MKIREKGLTGKAAQFRRDAIAGQGRKGFNAFKEMEKAKAGGAKADGADEKAKPEVWLDFMGARVRVHEDDAGKGFVKQEELPHVRGATLRFDGCGGEVSFEGIKVRAPPRPLPRGRRQR